MVWFRAELRRARKIRRRGHLNIILKAKEKKLLPDTGAETSIYDIFLADRPLISNLLTLFCLRQTIFEEVEEIHPPQVMKLLNHLGLIN